MRLRTALRMKTPKHAPSAKLRCQHTPTWVKPRRHPRPKGLSRILKHFSFVVYRRPRQSAGLAPPRPRPPSTTPAGRDRSIAWAHLVEAARDNSIRARTKLELNRAISTQLDLSRRKLKFPATCRASRGRKSDEGGSPFLKTEYWTLNTLSSSASYPHPSTYIHLRSLIFFPRVWTVLNQSRSAQLQKNHRSKPE